MVMARLGQSLENGLPRQFGMVAFPAQMRQEHGLQMRTGNLRDQFRRMLV
jgi:hypothetical protein